VRINLYFFSFTNVKNKMNKATLSTKTRQTPKVKTVRKTKVEELPVVEPTSVNEAATEVAPVAATEEVREEDKTLSFRQRLETLVQANQSYISGSRIT
jgi:hypothetical protein